MINLPITRLSGFKLDSRKVLLMALASLVIFYLDFNYVIKLQFKGLRTLAPKVAQLKRDIDGLAKDLSRLQELERSGAAKQRTSVRGSKEIVREDRILMLLQEVSDLANKSGARIVQINTSRDAKVKEELIASEKLVPVIINLDLSCGYHALGSFTAGLDSAKYFTEIEGMKITRDDRDYLLQNVSITLKTYARK